MINSFSIIIANTTRSILYLKILKKNKLYPNNIVYLDNKQNDNIRKIILKKSFSKSKSKLKIFNSEVIDKKKILNYIKNLKDKYIVYSGYPGKIIKTKKILKQKNLIHFHPGKLPFFKGSTTIYYSILKYNKIFCTSLILNEKIDNGKILNICRYPMPKNIKEIDLKYDDKIRANNLLDLLKNSNKPDKKYKRTNKILPYFVIHPVLRSIVFKKHS